MRPARPAGHGQSWEALAPRKDEIAGWVKQDLTLVKVGELLERSGTAVPYRTLARFAAAECGFSSSRPGVTVPVADGKPGQEVQVDFGYLGMIADGDRRRKLHALVFTAVFSRYCYVYLTFPQTTAAVIAGCEAAWAFFGGMFAVVIPDNLKPVVDTADRLEPSWNREWLEYAQARGLVDGPGEGAVAAGQGPGRGRGEVRAAAASSPGSGSWTSADAQRQADDWCRVRAGMRVHGTTRQRPAEVFAEHELPLLLPAPTEPYRVPAWSEAKVQRDFHVRAQNAFYSVPYALIGQQVTVRADDALVKVYHRGQVVKTHPRQPAGGRSSDAADFPPGTDVYARRDVDRLAAMAAARGEAIGIYAARILDTDLPWTKMRAVYALIGLCRTYGNGAGGAGVRGGAGTRRDQRRQDQVDRGEGHRDAGRAGRRPRPPGRRRGPEGHRGEVRPRPPRVRHRDRRPHAGPARRRRTCTRLTGGSRSSAPAGFISFRAIRSVSFISFVSFHSAVRSHARERTPSMTITAQAAAAAGTGREPGNVPLSRMREPGQGQGPRRAGPAARLLRAGSPRGPRRHRRAGPAHPADRVPPPGSSSPGSRMTAARSPRRSAGRAPSATTPWPR